MLLESLIGKVSLIKSQCHTSRVNQNMVAIALALSWFMRPHETAWYLCMCLSALCGVNPMLSLTESLDANPHPSFQQNEPHCWWKSDKMEQHCVFMSSMVCCNSDQGFGPVFSTWFCNLFRHTEGLYFTSSQTGSEYQKDILQVSSSVQRRRRRGETKEWKKMCLNQYSQGFSLKHLFCGC